MKIKRMLIILITALILIVILQTNVKAEDFDCTESELYGYYLTKTNKILEKEDLLKEENSAEIIIAAISSDYTGTIEYMSENIIRIRDIYGSNLYIAEENVKVLVEGENTLTHNIDTVELIEEYEIEGEIEYAPQVHFHEESNGMLELIIDVIYNFTYDGPIYGSEYYKGTNGGFNIFYFGPYIKNIGSSNSGNTMTKGIFCENLEQLSEEYWTIIQELSSKESIELNLDVEAGEVISTKLLNNIRECDDCWLKVYVPGSLWYKFHSRDITYIDKTFDFTAFKIEASYEPIGNMVGMQSEDAIYYNIDGNQSLPGPVVIEFPLLLEEDYADDREYKCYYFNEETKSYEACKDANYQMYTLKLNIENCGKYVISKTELLPEVEDDEKFPETEEPKDEKQEEQEETEEPKDEKQEEQKETEEKKDETTANGDIPYAGGMLMVIVAFIITAVVSAVLYSKNKDLKGI